METDEDDDLETTSIAYDAAGVPTVTGDPDPSTEKREPISAAQLQEAQDPLSAGLALIMAAAAQGNCDAVAKVYDGRRRFNMVGKDLGEGKVRRNSFSPYSGPAMLCEITFKPIAGYRTNGKDRKNFPKRMVIFLARTFEGGPLVPVRMEGDSDFGAIMVHMTSITVE